MTSPTIHQKPVMDNQGNWILAPDLKSRIAIGTAYDWEARRLPMLVKLARMSFHEYLGWRRIKGLA